MWAFIQLSIYSFTCLVTYVIVRFFTCFFDSLLAFIIAYFDVCGTISVCKGTHI